MSKRVPILRDRIPTQDTGTYRSKEPPFAPAPAKDPIETLRDVKKDNQQRTHEQFIDRICSDHLGEVPIQTIARRNHISTREVRQILISEGYIK